MSKTKTAVKRIPGAVPVKTKFGNGAMLGDDGRGNACVSFSPGAAPQLEKLYWLGGPNYTCMIQTSDILERLEIHD